MEPLELQMQMLLLESLLRALEEAAEDQAQPELQAMALLEVFRLVVAEVEELLKQAHSLAVVALAQMAWQSSQLTSKHEIRSNQFRNKHRGERRYLGRRDSLDSSCWLLR
jgi:hypothetical protein